MNLKEAFRYQNFLDGIMSTAAYNVSQRDTAIKVGKLHKRHAANPDAEDIQETQDRDGMYDPMPIIALMDRLADERGKLSKAICDAKAGLTVCGTDMDSALETVKFIRSAANGIKNMLGHKAGKSVTKGSDYKFNAEGNQAPYVYEIEETRTENFDRAVCRAKLKDLLAKADNMSAEIEKAQVGTVVNYEPPFDVNDDFDEVLAETTAKAKS